MPQISDFQTVAEQWAKKIADSRRTHFQWVCLDGSHSDLKQYPQYKLSYQVNNPVYNWDQPSPQQDIMFKQHLENSGSEKPTTLVKRAERKSDTFSLSITEGIKLGISVTTKAGINIEGFAAGVDMSRSFDFNLSSTQAWTNTVERSWEVDQNIPQAPHSITEIEWLLDRKKAKGSFTANVVISGWVAVWFYDKIDLNDPNGKNLHWLWFPTAASIVREMKPAGFSVSGGNVIFNATGTIEADVGIESRLIVKETPLSTPMLLATGETAVNASRGATQGVSNEYIIAQDGKVLQGAHIAADSKIDAESNTELNKPIKIEKENVFTKASVDMDQD